MENNKLYGEKFLSDFYRNKINMDSLDNIFSDIDKNHNNINDEFIEKINDRFNLVFDSESNIRLSTQCYSEATKHLLYSLHLEEKYKCDKYETLRMFLTKEYLSSYRRAWFFKIDDKFFKLVKAIHKYVGQEFIDNLMIEMELNFNSNDLIGSYSDLFAYLELTSNHTNIVRYAKDLIQRVGSSYKHKIHYYIYTFYELRELSDNYEILLKVLSSQVLNHRKYFNSQTIVDTLEGYVKNPDKLFEIYEYCYNQGYISKEDLTYVNKCIINHII